jgi:DNA-directed RNA polymerase subunit RPC12/RpoP
VKAAKPSDSAPPPSTSDVEIEVACICGQLLKLSTAFAGRRAKCPKCGRRFVVTYDKDPRTGEEVPTPFYLPATGPSTGETQELAPVEKAPTPPEDTQDSNVVLPPEETRSGKPETPSDSDLEVLPDELIPDPPRALFFICPCGKKLLARKKMYDRRVRCPYCQVRLLISLVFDDVERKFDIQPVRLDDERTGKTTFLKD